MSPYDLVVIGSGPGGQNAAIAAAHLGKSVAMIESSRTLGGVCMNTGAIPLKSMREAAVYLTGLDQREIYGASYRVRERITWADLHTRTDHIINREIDLVRNELIRNGIDLCNGHARFINEHNVLVEDTAHGEHNVISGDHIIIATGTAPVRPSGVQFDDERVIDPDGILNLTKIPLSLVVVGAGVIGIEYASIFAALGTKVTVVDKRQKMLEFCDDEIVEALQLHLRDQSVTFRFGEEATAVDIHEHGTVTMLASGKRIAADTVLYSAGRQGCTDRLGLENTRLQTDNRGRISVDDNYRTDVKHVYAVGDVIGLPALAGTSAQQGRLAAHHVFGEPVEQLNPLHPTGIHTIPEVSYIGATEAELTAKAIPYEVGVARYREIARGQIAGDSHGMLKLLVSTDRRRLLGVHIFGSSATELVHIGQALMSFDYTIDYLVNTVFNYPTFSEAYKVAALDVTCKL